MTSETNPSNLLEAFILHETEPFFPRRRPIPPSLAARKRSSGGSSHSRPNKRIHQADAAAATAATIHSPELSENKEFLRLCIDLPGIPAKDIHVAVDHGVLTVKATRRSYSIDGATCLRQHHILKRFALDTDVLDVTRMTCSLALGVLTVQCGKKSLPHYVPIPVLQNEADESPSNIQLGGDLLPPTVEDDTETSRT